jgi:hypothetical protein
MSNEKGKGVNALYYPETICLDEIELKYLLLLYDKIFFLPIDNRLNPGHTSLSKRFSIRDTILTGAFKSKKDDHYAIMYCSEPNVWEELFGQILKSLVSLKVAPVLVGIQLVAGLSFWEILALSTSVIGGATLKHLVDAWQEGRNLRRNALFFLLRLQRR